MTDGCMHFSKVTWEVHRAINELLLKDRNIKPTPLLWKIKLMDLGLVCGSTFGFFKVKVFNLEDRQDTLGNCPCLGGWTFLRPSITKKQKNL